MGHFLMENAKRFRVETATSEEMTYAHTYGTTQPLLLLSAIVLPEVG